MEVAFAMLRNRVTSIGTTMEQLGWLDGCLYALSRMLAAASAGRVRIHKYYFVAQPVPQTSWLPGRRGQSFEVRRVGEADPLVKRFPRPARAAPFRFAQGAVCFAALREGAFAGFLWLTLGPYQEDEVRCRYVPLPAHEAVWDFDVYVEPEHRNGIAFLRLWDEANRFLAGRGIRWSLSRISAFNPGSILSHTRMKARRIGAATFLSVGPWQIAASTAAPRLHVSIREASFPTYALDARR